MRRHLRRPLWRLIALGLVVLAVFDSVEPAPRAVRRSTADASVSTAVRRDVSPSTTVPVVSAAPTSTVPPAPVTSVLPAVPGLVSSTAYCLTGTMANGEEAHEGAVAANRWPLGTVLRVSPSPVGPVVTVKDRIGSGSELDFALPGDCGAARSWGRRRVSVEVLDDGGG